MINTFYLLVAGPRSYNNYEEFSNIMDIISSKILTVSKRLVIVEGGALGVDGMARHYAITHEHSYIEMRAEWSKLGKQAGIIRNKKMHDYIRTKNDGKRAVLLFWNGTSRGTGSNIEIAKANHNPVCIVFIHTDNEVSKVPYIPDTYSMNITDSDCKYILEQFINSCI